MHTQTHLLHRYYFKSGYKTLFVSLWIFQILQISLPLLHSPVLSSIPSFHGEHTPFPFIHSLLLIRSLDLFLTTFPMVPFYVPCFRAFFMSYNQSLRFRTRTHKLWRIYGICLLGYGINSLSIFSIPLSPNFMTLLSVKFDRILWSRPYLFLIVHTPNDSHLGCLYFLGILNGQAMNFAKHMSLQCILLSSVSIFQVIMQLDHMQTLFLIL